MWHIYLDMTFMSTSCCMSVRANVRIPPSEETDSIWNQAVGWKHVDIGTIGINPNNAGTASERQHGRWSYFNDLLGNGYGQQPCTMVQEFVS